MTTLQASASDHFAELDGMRGVLAVVVMLYHLGLNTLAQRATGGLIYDSPWGLSVDFFFMLSGFVICRSFVLRPVGVGTFLVRRAARLAPLCAITTLAALAVSNQNWSPADIALNLLMLHSLFGGAAINGPSWSIPFEFTLPVAGFLLVGYLRGRRAVVLLCLSLATAGSIIACVALSWRVDLPSLRACVGLAAGATLYLFADNSDLVRRPRPIAALIVFASAIAVMALSGPWPGLAAVFPILSLLAIWLGANCSGTLSTRPFQLLGSWSYAIYLIHWPLLLLFVQVFGERALQGNIALKACIVLLTLILAAVSYRCIELPFIRLAKRARERRSQPA
jgi:peptidoglycan/LPS O-acetylase OafA/YrhL